MKVHLSLSYSLKIEDCFIRTYKRIILCIWNTVIFIFDCGLKFHFGMDCITWSSLICVLLFYASHAVNHLDYLGVQEAWISGPWVPSHFYKYAFLNWISFSFAFIEAVIRSTNLWDSEFNMPCSNLSRAPDHSLQLSQDKFLYPFWGDHKSWWGRLQSKKRAFLKIN